MTKTEITVLTAEQIEFLGNDLKKDVVFLQENMHQKDLAVLNPLVSELIEMEETVNDLKLVPAENNEYDKKNIQAFTDVKKTIRSYRAAVKKSAKELKTPYQDVVKSIISIEKTFINSATELFDKAETEFAPYVEFVEAEKQRKEDEKNKALLEAVKEQENKSKEIEQNMARQSAYNNIRYERINKYQNTIDEAITNGSISFLRSRMDYIKNATIIEQSDYDVLSEDNIKEIQAVFAEKKMKWFKILSDRIQSMQAEIDREIERKAKEQSIPTPVAIKNIQVDEEVVENFQIGHLEEKGKELYYMAKQLLENDSMNLRLLEYKHALSIFIN